MKVCLDKRGNLHVKDECEKNEVYLSELECVKRGKDCKEIDIKEFMKRLHQPETLLSILIECICKELRG